MARADRGGAPANGTVANTPGNSTGHAGRDGPAPCAVVEEGAAGGSGVGRAGGRVNGRQKKRKRKAALPSYDVMALTRRERDVLVAMANGRRNREIATELFISLHTVTHHVSRIYAKLGVQTRSQAVIFAIRAGAGRPTPVTRTEY